MGWFCVDCVEWRSESFMDCPECGARLYRPISKYD